MKIILQPLKNNLHDLRWSKKNIFKTDGKWKSGPNSISFEMFRRKEILQILHIIVCPDLNSGWKWYVKSSYMLIKLILEQILDQTKSAMVMKFEERDGDLYENYILTRFDDLFSF